MELVKHCELCDHRVFDLSTGSTCRVTNSKSQFQDKLFDQLSNRKPFQNFKFMIDSSEYRQDWFDFKKKGYIEFVKGQII